MKLMLAMASLCLLMLVTGCGSADQATVHGNVTFDGAMVELGEIVFTPSDTSKTAVGAKIENGKYQCSLPVGPSKVRITAYRDIPGSVDRSNPGQERAKREMYIPAKFNSASTLEANISSSSSPLNFELVKG